MSVNTRNPIKDSILDCTYFEIQDTHAMISIRIDKIWEKYEHEKGIDKYEHEKGIDPGCNTITKNVLTVV